MHRTNGDLQLKIPAAGDCDQASAETVAEEDTIRGKRYPCRRFRKNGIGIPYAAVWPAGGIVRPLDVTRNNTIAYEKVAEARISYGGRGRIMEVQQPGWGHQIYDKVAPF